jgi:CPA1 family monovalent cation:H+ antiporter
MCEGEETSSTGVWEARRVLEVLAFVLAAVAAISLVEVLAERSGLPAAVMLTIVGLAYAGLPGPNLHLDPHVVLTFVLPPLLYSAALNSSLLAIRRNLRPVISLSVVLVLVTTLTVGFGTHLFVPGITLAAGFALGAAVAPPDPVAALAIGRRAGLPPRLITLIEGEGLLNDATALTAFTVAVAAMSNGGFSPGMAVGRFVLAVTGGIVVGVGTAYAVRYLRKLVHEPIVLNSLSLATPFLAYLIGEELHVSGVLAVVITGLMVGHDTPRAISGASRLQTAAVWRLVDFLLEGFVFLLIGQQLPAVVKGLSAYPASTIWTAAGVTVGVVLLVRPLWLVLTQSVPRALHMRLATRDPEEHDGLTKVEVLVMSWAGTRGVISLAAIFSVPLAADSGRIFPERDLLLFCTFLVVLVTLLGQGLTFAPLTRALGLRADFADEARVRNEARSAAVTAALTRLDERPHDEQLDEDVITELRANLGRRAARYQQRLELLDTSEDGEIPTSHGYTAAVALRREVIDAQREELLRWRDAGRLPDASLRTLEHELDLEEHTLPRS